MKMTVEKQKLHCSLLGQKSAIARRKKLGKKGFSKAMSKIGTIGALKRWRKHRQKLSTVSTN